MANQDVKVWKGIKAPKFPGKRMTINGNTLVATTEGLIADAGIFYPITPSTEMGETFQFLYAKGQLNAFGKQLTAIETEGEHAAQGGAIAMSVTGKRTVNFTSGQGIVYGLEQYYHAPGKLSTMVLEVGARALTKHALNVHAGHDDVYATLDTGWIVLFAKDAQQAADQAIILRRVTEDTLNPGINAMDGFLTTHLERTFFMPEAALVREFLGDADDIIECRTEAQRVIFGPTRKRVPAGIDLKNPILLGPVQNQEHYMNGVAARRNNFSEGILDFLEKSYDDFAALTGRQYGLISEYNTENADTVFVSIGSSAENIEAMVDYLKETRNEEVGVIHVNVIRPFPENAIIKALKGKKNVIILERTDEPLAGDNPLTRDIKVALAKAEDNFKTNAYEGLEKLNPETEKPMIFSGVYGLGSRDFRPEGIIGAYDFAKGRIKRKDGKGIEDGVRFFYVGIDHPYAVVSDETPSGLPEKAIAIRFHSIGGWGMITTGKNMGSILGDLAGYVAKRDNRYDANGELEEIIHISANPKYGSEKKGAPTNYFLVAAPERVKVNADLRHVDVVLCADPKVFLHTNALQGLKEGGAFVWESNEENPADAWNYIPTKYRQEIIDRNIRVYILNGFKIAKAATEREELQTRMQGNAFLGAFFGVSSFLKDYNIPKKEFEETIHAQYVKKFGRFGDDVVNSNMTVMKAGFEQVKQVPIGKVDAPDASDFVGHVISPCGIDIPTFPKDKEGKSPIHTVTAFDAEFRAGYGYNQPSTPLASVGYMASATGETASKYVARRAIPKFLEENCTQCMECISVCPDTAMPNTTQDISQILKTAINYYVSDGFARNALLEHLDDLDAKVRADMLAYANDKELKKNPDDRVKFENILRKHLYEIKSDVINDKAINQVVSIVETLPLAFMSVRGIFSGREKKNPGDGGIFSIFINDKCKGCGECVEACGDHEALIMIEEDEDWHARVKTQETFLKLLPETPKKYLGIYNPDDPYEAKAAALKNHLMQQSKYNALVSGDGACAGCGEKSILRAVATVTEAVMRPLFKAKAARLTEKVAQLGRTGLMKLEALKAKDKAAYTAFRRTILHIVMGFGAENTKATDQRIAEGFNGSDADLIDALQAVLKQEAYNHNELQTIEGHMPNGMSAMAMTANTGCNTVYGSTPPNNPHPYPWMNSLFQDGTTIGWIVGESFIRDHAAHSVIPERLVDYILDGFSKGYDEEDYFHFTHFSDKFMTDKEVLELPKVWAIGGDGGIGDIGFQNLSKVVLQNRPNIKVLMLDTQVYSNTGGQNSDSSVMTGGFDMNQIGAATEGKMTEKKSVSEILIAGHGSPYVAQVSAASMGTLFRALIDGLHYRGTAYYQAFTTCQPEHGVPDDASEEQAIRIRDSRGMPEFIFDPEKGETYQEALYIKGNPNYQNDWYTKRCKATKERFTYTVAHWALTEARFRRHHKKVSADKVEGKQELLDVLKNITMQDIIHHRYLDKNHRSYIPDWGVYLVNHTEEGKVNHHLLSRQMVIFCVERRKAWRMLQSRAGIENKDYIAQKEYLKGLDA